MVKNDLISRSALVDVLEDTGWFSPSKDGRMKIGAENSEKAYVHYLDVVTAVEDAPAVDAVELPVRPGRVVWILNHRFPAEIEEICIREDGVFAVWVEYDRSPELKEVWDDGEFDIKEVGKTVFLTVEELEKAEAEG